MERKPRLLFFCVTNSCRSQMAEGWARHLRAAEIEAFSAGARLGSLDPDAARVMAEIGVDIAQQRSKTLADFHNRRFDLVITLCSVAHLALTDNLPGSPRILRLDIPNPRHPVAVDAQALPLLQNYRRVRDQLRQLVESLDFGRLTNALTRRRVASRAESPNRRYRRPVVLP